MGRRTINKYLYEYITYFFTRLLPFNAKASEAAGKSAIATDVDITRGNLAIGLAIL